MFKDSIILTEDLLEIMYFLLRRIVIVSLFVVNLFTLVAKINDFSILAKTSQALD